MHERDRGDATGRTPLLVSLAVLAIAAVTVMVLGRDVGAEPSTGAALPVSETVPSVPPPVPLAPATPPSVAPSTPSTSGAPSPTPPSGPPGPAPRAVIADPVTSVVAGGGDLLPLRVALDARGSTGRGLRYAWDLDGDGVLDDATWPDPVVTFEERATVRIVVQVRDDRGRTGRADVVLRPGTTPPTQR